jgi:alpha-glucosidase (family GH31 glycosyl hydrolase)
MELERIPIFVRQGAVIAEGPAVQHTGEINKENRIEKIRVFGYPHADSLRYEPDISLIQEQDSSRLTFKHGIKFEVYDTDYSMPEEGTLLVS